MTGNRLQTVSPLANACLEWRVPTTVPRYREIAFPSRFDSGWFGELAAILRQAGSAEVMQGAACDQPTAVTTSQVV
jgi:hypothetical protein